MAKLQDNRSIPFRDSLDLVSAFVIQTTEFLNKFASTCEERLAQVEYNIQQLEVTLGILESKLASIDNVQMPVVAQTTTQPVQSLVVPPTTNVTVVVEDTPPPPPTTSSVVLIKDEKRLEKYFTLVRLRVPSQQIKMAMEREGFDPTLIDRPDDPSPFEQGGEDLQTDGSFTSDSE